LTRVFRTPLTRLSFASIPLIVLAKTVDSWGDCLRCASHYGVRWYELPATFVLAAVVRAMEAPGMVRAFSRQEITTTAYR